MAHHHLPVAGAQNIRVRHHVGPRAVGTGEPHHAEGPQATRDLALRGSFPAGAAVRGASGALLVLGAVRSNQTRIAKANVDAIAKHYPDGSLIGLSIGHVGKTSNPADRGAVVVGTGLMESDVCTGIIEDMATLLTEEADMAAVNKLIVAFARPDKVDEVIAALAKLGVRAYEADADEARAAGWRAPRR